MGWREGRKRGGGGGGREEEKEEVAGGDEDEWKRKERGEVAVDGREEGLMDKRGGGVEGSYIKILKMYECIGNEAT